VTNLSLRFLLLTGVLALALAALTHSDDADARTQRATLLAQIDDLRAETWRLQRLMGKPRTETNYAERRTKSDTYRRWVRNLWRKRALTAARRTARSGSASTATSPIPGRAGARAPATASTAVCR
jgi:hypothetical protein